MPFMVENEKNTDNILKPKPILKKKSIAATISVNFMDI